MTLIHPFLREKCNSQVTGLDDECIQPNALDVRIHSIHGFQDSPFFLSEKTKVNRMGYPIELKKDVSNESYWVLNPGAYPFETTSSVVIAEGEAAWLRTRSTLIRNGLFVVSGLYDSGYNGPVGGVLHVTSGTATIYQNTRIAQLIFCSAETTHLYDGSYGYGKQL